MHGASVCYDDNTSWLVLDELRDSGDETSPPRYINELTVVTVEAIRTLDGALLTTVSYPIAMPYVTGSNGKYRVKLPATLTDGVPNEAVIEAEVKVIVQTQGGDTVLRFFLRVPTRRRVV